MIGKGKNIQRRERKKYSFSFRSWDKSENLSKGNNSITNAFIIKVETILAGFFCREVGFYIVENLL